MDDFLNSEIRKLEEQVRVYRKVAHLYYYPTGNPEHTELREAVEEMLEMEKDNGTD